MDTYEDLIYSAENGILTLEIDRPDKRNALRLSLREELIDAIIRAEDDDAIRAIIVTGAGRKAFSSGADLSELQTRTVDSEMSRAAMLRRKLPEVAETCSKPLIAAINGACIGAGLEFAMGCHFRVASSTAVFGLPEVPLGTVPGSGGTQRLPRIVGLGWAMHMILLGEPIQAQQALQIGLVTALYEPDQLLPEATSLAEKLSKHPQIAYSGALDATNVANDVSLTTGIEFERRNFALCLSTGLPQERARKLQEQITSASKITQRR